MVQENIKKLENLGRMPDESNENLSVEQLKEYDRLMKEAIRPISFEDAKILIKLFPESSLYGGEWTLLHLFETVKIPIDDYRKLIEECPSEEWKERLTVRLNNYLASHQ
ncbi:hypothetical protein FACS1894177_06100 [Bacteroidia bacterium]|nr:hypothetical protein FACS1894177_06100 [Bacteroidia bacterium]